MDKKEIGKEEKLVAITNYVIGAINAYADIYNRLKESDVIEDIDFDELCNCMREERCEQNCENSKEEKFNSSDVIKKGIKIHGDISLKKIQKIIEILEEGEE